MNILIACEYSGRVREAFRAKGHNAWSCDLLPSEDNSPWQFGHGETKATCLWLKGLPKLVPTNIVEGRSDRIHKMPPGPNRWKERSRTYQGIALGMAEQWG